MFLGNRIIQIRVYSSIHFYLIQIHHFHAFLRGYFNKAISFEYVWAIINTREQGIKIYYQAAPEAPKQLIRTESYKLREPVKNNIPIKEFC